MVTPEHVERVYQQSLDDKLRPADMLLPNDNVIHLTSCAKAVKREYVAKQLKIEDKENFIHTRCNKDILISYILKGCRIYCMAPTSNTVEEDLMLPLPQHNQ